MIRMPLVLLLAALAAVPVLQGCVPLVAAGAAGTALIATDRRTTGVYIEDENIELKALGRLHEIPDAHVNAASFNERVLLTGEVPDEATRKRVQEAIRTIPSVREVMDETQIAGASSLTSRGNDTLITSNVKARMLNDPRFNATQVKVVTEAGVVYLMGLVTHAEADAATEVARTTSGVSRVVTEFEYIS
ncbi:MAG TPA: BON domain-containing protein [Usitatibacter sp.]|nr:BON domain-containing protein [Usitatibacter sp.]